MQYVKKFNLVEFRQFAMVNLRSVYDVCIMQLYSTHSTVSLYKSNLKVVVEEHNIAIIVFFYENVYIIPLLKRWNSLFIKIYTIYANTTFKRLRNKSVRCPASSTEPTNADPCALRCLRGQTAWERATDYFFYHVGSLKIFSTLCMIFKHEKSKIKYTLMYFIKLTVCRAGKR